MKTLKLIGIIALSALIMIWAVGCEGLFGTPEDDDDGTDIDDDELEANSVVIVASPNGLFQGQVLTANYNGSKLQTGITYKWWYNTTNTTTDWQDMPVGGTEKTWKAGSVGWYTVDIKIPNYEVKRATPVEVKAPPFAGVWLMTGSQNGGWLGATDGNTTVVNETINVTYTRFRITNTLNQYIDYDITSWEVYSGTLTGYTAIYKLTVNNRGTQGYTVTTANAIFLYMNSAGDLFWGNNITTSDTGTVTHNIWASAQNQMKPRNYVKQSGTPTFP